MPTAVRPCEHRNDSSDIAVVALYICIFLISRKDTLASRGETRKLDVASMCINYDSQIVLLSVVNVWVNNLC